MSDEFDWDKEVSEWQSLKPELPELKKNMRWLSMRMKLVLALDIAVLLLLVPLAFFIFQTEESLSVKVWFVLVSIFAAVGVYFDFYLRRDLWDIPITIRGMYQHLIKRAQAGINIAKFSIIYLSFFIVLLAFWASYIGMYEPERFERSNSVISLVFGGSVLIISIGVSVWYGKRKKYQLKDAQKRYQEFLDSGDGAD